MQSSRREDDSAGIFKLVVHDVSADCFDVNSGFLSVPPRFLQARQRQIEADDLKAMFGEIDSVPSFATTQVQ